MEYKNIIIGVLFTLLASNAYTQVTIGQATKPEEFSTVQVELGGVLGGISLPKVTNVEKINPTWKTILTASNASSGLVVFNSDANKIEYWDGTAWIILSGEIEVGNGLSKSVGEVIKLGGDLTDASTVIDQAGNSFNVLQSTNTGEKFEVNAISATGTREVTTLSIANTAVSITPNTALAINNDAMIVKNQIVDIKSPDFRINIDQGNGTSASTKLKLDNAEVLIDAPLHYRNEAANDNSGYLLTSDNQGNASWGALRPLGAVLEGRLNDNVSFMNIQADITYTKITLPAGQWLVFAQCNTVTMVPSNLMVMYNWLELVYRKAGTQDTPTKVRVAGTNPESKTYNQLAYATPSFSYYLNIKEPTQIWVEAVSSNNYRINRTTTETFLGPSYFFAVRLDVPIE